MPVMPVGKLRTSQLYVGVQSRQTGVDELWALNLHHRGGRLMTKVRGAMIRRGSTRVPKLADADTGCVCQISVGSLAS